LTEYFLTGLKLAPLWRIGEFKGLNVEPVREIDFFDFVGVDVFNFWGFEGELGVSEFVEFSSFA
jgi:hypothetical protein